jgi:sulfoxide reductase heme-binding subunit YedZ
MSLLLTVGSAKQLWYVTRATGIVALLLLTAVVLLGVASSIRWRGRRSPRFVVADLHRNLTLAAIAFIAVHVVTTVVDRFAPIGLKDAVIPFLSPYRPIWLGIGAVSFDLLLALVISSLLRVRVGYPLWRALHWSAYAAWPLAVVHGLGTGSDSRVGWVATLTALCVAAVSLALALRIVRGGGVRPLRIAAAVAMVASITVIIGWYRTGPARPGWAARAGTPSALLASHRVAPVGHPRAARQRARQLFAVPFSGALDARIARSEDQNGDVGIAIGGDVRGTKVAAVMSIRLWGAASENGVAMTASRVTFSPVGSKPYAGKIVALAGKRIVASVTNTKHQRLRLAIVVQVDTATGAVTGDVRGRAG